VSETYPDLRLKILAAAADGRTSRKPSAEENIKTFQNHKRKIFLGLYKQLLNTIHGGYNIQHNIP
jgi:hypothetical protein